MIFETHTLEKPFENFIGSIFYFKGFKPEHSIERVVPTGHVFIIFELDGIPRNTFDNETLEPNGTYTDVWVSGMHKSHLSISAHQDSEMLVIQFKTSGAYPFLNTPVHELNNRVVAAQELFGDEILELRKQVLKDKSASEKFKSVENWLKKRFDASKAPQKDILNILTQLETKPIAESSKILESYSNTQKHLIHQFKTYFGLTPKVFQRIFRFNEILKQIQDKEQLEWSQIAHGFGYSDQSHFIKEFKEFSGFNPQEFIKSEYHKEETNFFPLDKKG